MKARNVKRIPSTTPPYAAGGRLSSFLMDRLYYIPPLVLLLCFLLYFAKPTEMYVRPSPETSGIILLMVLLGLFAAWMPKARTYNLAFRPIKNAHLYTTGFACLWLLASAAREKLPLLALLQGDTSVNYTDFGSFNAFGHSAMVFSFYLTLFHVKPGLKRLVLGALLLAMSVMIVSRIVIIEMLLVLLIYGVLEKGLFSTRNTAVFLVSAFGLGTVSEIRTPMAYLERYWLLSPWMMKLPVFLVWLILYATSPILNLIYFIEQGIGGTSGGVLTLASMLPGFVSKKLFASPVISRFLYYEHNNVYTLFGKYYLDFGTLGLFASMVAMVLIYKYIICSFDRATRSLFVYPALFVFFADTFVFFPTILLFSYLVIFCRSYRYIEGEDAG